MKDRSSFVNLVFVIFIVCLAVVISVRGKWSALETVADSHTDTYIVKHTGYYDTRAITGAADGSSDVPIDRLNDNGYSTTMIGDTRGISTTASTMMVP